LGVLPGGPDTHDLAAELVRGEIRGQHAIGVGQGVSTGRVAGTRGDRQTVGEPVFLRPVVAVVRGAAAEAERGRAAAGDRIVRTARHLGVVRVEVQREAVVDVPLRVEADRVHRVLLHVTLLLEAEVLRAAGDVADVQGGTHVRMVVEDHVRQVVLQPHGLLATTAGDLVGRVGVVQGEGQRVGGGELQHRLRIGALAVELLVRVTHVVRHRVQLTDLRRVLHDRAGQQLGIGAGPAGHVPGVLGRLDRTTLALLVAGAQGHAPGLVGVGVAEDARHFRGDVAADGLRVVGHGLDAGAGDHFAAAVVERARGQDVDGGADAAAGLRRAAGLVHGHAVDRLGSQLGEVEGTRAGTYAADHRLAATEAVGTGDLAAVESHQVELRTKAARGHLGAFTVTSLDRDTGDALQGLGVVG